MSKKITKNPKFNSDDILKYTNPITNQSFTVILTIRWDITSSQDVAWYYRSYPDGTDEFAAPETEFSVIDNS